MRPPSLQPAAGVPLRPAMGARLPYPTPGPAPGSARWTGRGSALPVSSVFVFILLHLPLVVGMRLFPLVATVHVYSTLAMGLALAAQVRTPAKILPILGYIAGSEPIWRATGAVFFHEGAKYALAGLAGLVILRFGLLRRASKVPVVCLLLLLPSILVLPRFSRGDVSFNLSGPLALMVLTLMLTAWRLSPRVLIHTFVSILAPSVAFAFLATFTTATTEDIDFYFSKVASAGLGKNQASTALALIGLLAFLQSFLDRRHRGLGWLMGIAGIWCTGQAALTFSRGGVYTTVGAIAAASFVLLLDRRSRMIVFIQILIVAALAVYLVIPVLSHVTGGAIESRFKDTQLTGRDKLIEADLKAFREHPFLGVGPGQSVSYHQVTFRRSPAHTEYSRLLAEHGALGLLAMLLFGGLIWSRLRQPAALTEKAAAVGLVSWCLLYMTHSAMRMAMPCLVLPLGLALLTPVRTRQPRPGGRP